jgi:hypothetical protein
MSDLVDRLNTYGTGSSYSLLLMREAADRIEALEAALREIADRMPHDFTLAQEMAQIASTALAREQERWAAI